jgi:hypothetical protein
MKTKNSDSQTSLKDVVDQLTKRIDAAEARVAALKEARSGDYSTRLAKLAPARKALLTEVGGIKTSVLALQAEFSELKAAPVHSYAWGGGTIHV